MKTQREIEQLADEALSIIDNLQPAEANNFLIGKIQARMQYRKREQHVVTTRVLSRLSIALLLFVGLNGASFYYLTNRQPQQQTKQQSKVTASEALASEYNLKADQYSY